MLVALKRKPLPKAPHVHRGVEGLPQVGGRGIRGMCKWLGLETPLKNINYLQRNMQTSLHFADKGIRSTALSWKMGLTHRVIM